MSNIKIRRRWRPGMDMHVQFMAKRINVESSAPRAHLPWEVFCALCQGGQRWYMPNWNSALVWGNAHLDSHSRSALEVLQKIYGPGWYQMERGGSEFLEATA